MNIKDYDKKIVLAFGCGYGGLIVKENYDEAIKEAKTLEGIVEDVIYDIGLDTEEYSHLIPIKKPTNDEERINFIEEFIEHKESNPELCGIVAGALFRSGQLKRTLEFLEVIDMEEERYWDS